MRKFFIVSAVVLTVFSLFVGVSYAGEVDILLDKLVEKGILSAGEAQEIKVETQEQVKKDLSRGKSESVPKWVQGAKIKGDFRLRWEHKDKTASQTQDRARLRARLGLYFKPNEQMEVGLRIASGSAEQTSTNQTLTDSFSSKYLYLDQAYIKYMPFASLDLAFIGGKMDNPFYRAQKSDLIWDGDVNPEGVALCWQVPLTKEVGFFVNAGGFPLYESSSDYDEPSLWAAQTGLSGQYLEKGSWKIGLGYYDFLNLKGADLDNISTGYVKTGNTLATGNIFVYDYNLMDIQAETTLPWPLTLPVLRTELPVTIYGNMVENLFDKASGSYVKPKYTTAWLAGINFGKAKDPGTWEFGYNYRKIEKDSVLAFLTDSDFHGGGVNAEGHKFAFKYALLKNSSLGLTFLKTDVITGSKSHYDTLQVDWETKF